MAKRVWKNKCRPTNHSSGDREAVFLRNESLRSIIRDAFAQQGAKPYQRDVDLSTKLSEQILCLIEQTGAKGDALRRKAQLFAAFTLLRISKRSQTAPKTRAKFLSDLLGPEWRSTVRIGDLCALDPINTALEELLVQPQWSAVLGGHVALSCISLLFPCDVSFLNGRMPQAGGVQ